MNQIEGEYNYSATIDVQWPFGYGLSYTKFEYSDFLTDKKSFKHSDNITFTISVKNVGKCTGKEIIQLWSSDLVASVSPDVIRMRGFEKIELEPGESATVSITIPASDLAFVGMDGKWRLEEGDFNIKMGNLNTRIRCTEDFVWKTSNIENEHEIIQYDETYVIHNSSMCLYNTALVIYLLSERDECRLT